MCVCVCVNALISVKYYITIFDSAPGKIEMPYKTENQLNSIRSVNGFQCLLSALHKCWHPVGLLRLRMNATVSCRMGSVWRFMCCTELIIFRKVASVRLRKTNYFFFFLQNATYSLWDEICGVTYINSDYFHLKLVQWWKLKQNVVILLFSKPAFTVMSTFVSSLKPAEINFQWLISHDVGSWLVSSYSVRFSVELPVVLTLLLL